MGGGRINSKYILIACLLCTILFTVPINMDLVSATTTQNKTINADVNHNFSTNIKTYTNTQKSVSATNPTVKISLSKLSGAAKGVNNYILINHKLPDYITISKNKVSMPQFLDLLTSGVLKIKHGSNSQLTLRTVKYPDLKVEKGRSGNIKSNEYLNIAKILKTYISSNHKIPAYKSTSKGKFVYGTLIFTYDKIIIFQKSHKRLPNYVSINSWMSIIRGKPVYITSDNIVNTKVDNARVNSIVKKLKALGLYAQNFGLGPNKHIEVLKSSKVPQNSLVIDIYGGACAGTLFEMGLKYYKSIKGNREVYAIFWPPAAVITDLDFLPRAHDDDFTPAYNTTKAGRFMDFKDLDHDGQFDAGEDGLAHPDIYLHKNGYRYYYSGDINKIVNAIFKQSVT